MNTITFDRASVVSVSINKDPKTNEAYLANIRIADSKYKSSAAREKAKNEGKETDNFFTLNIWKNEIQKFNKDHASTDGQKIEDLVPGCKIKLTGHLTNNNYMSNGVKVYKDVVVADTIEILSFPKAKDASEEETSSGSSDVTPAPESSMDVETENKKDENIPTDFQEEIPEDIQRELENANNSGSSEIKNPFEDEEEDLPF